MGLSDRSGIEPDSQGVLKIELVTFPLHKGQALGEVIDPNSLTYCELGWFCTNVKFSFD